MDRFIVFVLLGSAAISHVSLADTKSGKHVGTQPASTLGSASIVSQDIPRLPTGNSTVLGGSIRNIDPVRDQFTLKVFGGNSIKILFDERTQVYLDGTRIFLHDLRPEDHASIKTTLDGTNIFALDIHISSKSLEGECKGQVLNYNHRTHVLTVSSDLSHQQIELSVPADTPIVRIGQALQDQPVSSTERFISADSGSPNFIRGTLISAKFISDNKGAGIASQIEILAIPGSVFIFNGKVISLDLHAEQLMLVDPRDETIYKIFFDPSLFPLSRDMHEGAHVTVTTNFDGVRYVASAITAN